MEAFRSVIQRMIGLSKQSKRAWQALLKVKSASDYTGFPFRAWPDCLKVGDGGGKASKAHFADFNKKEFLPHAHYSLGSALP